MQIAANILCLLAGCACGKSVRLYLLDEADHGVAEFGTEEVCDVVDDFINSILYENI